MPVRNSLPPVSYISNRSHSYDHYKMIHTRYTVENCLGAWPGDHKHNNDVGYNAPDPTLLTMDPYGRRRWVDVGAGGSQNVSFTAEPDCDWLIATPNKGNIRNDGSTDVRVWISVDWKKIKAQVGHVTFSSSDGSSIVVSVPVANRAVPTDFHGAVEGDGYIAIEAAHFQGVTNVDDYKWDEIPFFGRTRSAMSVYPVDHRRFEVSAGPSLRYNFWTHQDHEDAAVTLHMSPSLNFILGTQLAFGVQMDDGKIITVEPVPKSALGSLPDDWESVVANEIREIDLTMTLSKGNRHSLTIWGVTTGVVVERILIDLGGIRSRGTSYLGPPESVIL